jgi:hypothetical protein
MKHLKLLVIGLVVLLSSCTAYKAGQTPDDVYYSPSAAARGGEETVRKQRGREEQEYQEYISSQDDAYLRRKVTNRNRWSTIDDFSYWNDCRYSFFPTTFNHFNPYFSCLSCNTFNPYFNWGHSFMGGGMNGSIFGGFGFGNSFGWNNPYYTLVHYGTPNFKGGGGTVSVNNLSAARNKSYNNSNYYSLPKGSSSTNSRGQSFGNLMKTVFTPAANGYQAGSYDRASRSFSGSSSGGSMPATSSSAGGNSGGFGSVGSSAGGGRGGRN